MLPLQEMGKRGMIEQMSVGITAVEGRFRHSCRLRHSWNKERLSERQPTAEAKRLYGYIKLYI
jgi:hypothetical protein